MITTQDAAQEVYINNCRYIPANTKIPDEALKLLAQVYSVLWTEAYYDPYNEDTRKFATPLADIMTQINKLIKFKQ